MVELDGFGERRCDEDDQLGLALPGRLELRNSCPRMGMSPSPGNFVTALFVFFVHEPGDPDRLAIGELNRRQRPPLAQSRARQRRWMR